ncbi:zinc finger protein 850-like [Macrobrachium rosenbergii]|uniref:zinc finger protein 850-like n=1 Tax=Macrobrachium rosenbergii TaxID=79674 RepID=UPI0034D5598C
MKVHGNELNHMCPFCGQNFLSLTALKKHERCHKGRQLSSFRATDQFLRDVEFQNHVQVPHKEFYCPYCYKSFSSKSFVAHKEYNSEAIGKTLRCQLCGLYFLHWCQLLEHNIEHKRLDKKLTNCVQEKLQKWVVWASGEYMYCRLCGKSYKILDAVISHLESHFREFVDHKRLQKSASYSLPLDNKSWEKAALLQCIDEISPRTLPKKIFFLVNSNNVKQTYTPLSNSEKERNFDDRLTVCQSDDFCSKKYSQSSRGSVTYKKDVVDVMTNIKSKSSFEEPGKGVYNCSSSSKSQVTKHIDNDSSGANQLIDCLMTKSQEIPATQKVSEYEIGNSKTVDGNTSKSHSKESVLLKNNRKEVPLRGNETTAKIVSVTSAGKDMNVVVGKAYVDCNQARSKRIYTSKSPERLCQSRDDGLKFKSEFLKCPACHLSFDRQAFVSHISVHEKDSWFICHDCGLSFWCQGNLKKHCLSNHPGERGHHPEEGGHHPGEGGHHPEEGGHSGKTVKIGSSKKKKAYIKLKKKNEVIISPYEKKYSCTSCGIDCSSWGDFLNHIFTEKEGEFCCLEHNTCKLNENQKSILKRTHEEYVHNEKMLISKWRKYFGISGEVKVFLECMVPCKTCGEYYGTTEEARQKHQVVHKKPKNHETFGSKAPVPVTKPALMGGGGHGELQASKGLYNDVGGLRPLNIEYTVVHVQDMLQYD